MESHYFLNLLLRFSYLSKKRGEWVMDAKYNYIVDSMKWRIMLNLGVFGLWLAASVILLHLA